MINKLEKRFLFDIAIYGNDGHAHIAVDVVNADGSHGVLHSEFHASGFCGHPGVQPGGIALVWGVDGFIHSWYNPDQTVEKDSNLAQYRFDTTTEQDKAVAEAMEAAGAMDIDSLGADQKDEYHSGNGDFDTYMAGSWNCFSYVNRMFEAAYGNVFVDTYRWDQLKSRLDKFDGKRIQKVMRFELYDKLFSDDKVIDRTEVLV